jgi:uncharacterized protein (TIGR01777 family)
MRPASSTSFPGTTPRTHEFHTHLPYPAADVWDWHTRPGAVVRLTPGAAHMRVTGEADSLRDGTTTFRLPAGLRWVARHDPAGFDEGRSFTDVCVNSPMNLSGWRHEHLINPADVEPDGAADGEPAGTTTVTDRITARVPEPLLRRIAAYRGRQLTDDLNHLAELRELDTRPRTIAVTGPTGLVGTRLVALLRTAGHTVIPLSRHETPGGRRWDPADPAPDLLDGVDTVIHLAGAPIFGRFTDAHRAAVRDSRVGPTRRLAELAAASGVGTFVCASAVGFYGARRPEPVGEGAPRGDGFLADVVSDWEADCEPAHRAGLRVVNIRTGLVLAGGSPLLTLLAASSRAGGGRLGRGTQHFPWIGVDDLTDIYHRAAVDPALDGPVNAVAPEDITEAEFAGTLADLQRVRVPLRIPVPAVGPEVLLGRVGAAELALADQHARPVVLERSGHPFRFTTARDLLRHELL